MRISLVVLFIFFSINSLASESLVKLSFIKSKETEVFVKGELKGAPASWVKIIRVDEKCLWAQLPFKQQKGLIGFSSCQKIPKKSLPELTFQKKLFISQSEFEIELSLDDKKLSLQLPNNKRIETLAPHHRFFPTVKLGEKTTFCKVYSKGCQLIKNECHLCPHGSVSAAISACPNKMDRYCVQKECGKRNQLACRRGNVYSELEALKGCQNAGVEGYCEQGLEIFCENSQLYCR